MAVRKNNRVALNRATFDAITLGMADGLLALADAVIAAAKPPDEPAGSSAAARPNLTEGGAPRPELDTTGGSVAYVLGKKVGGTASKPRAMRVKSMGVAIAGGFGFPGHFAEFGTIHEPAHPFLTPALMATLPDAEPFVRAAMAKRLASVGTRAATSAAIAARAR